MVYDRNSAIERPACRAVREIHRSSYIVAKKSLHSDLDRISHYRKQERVSPIPCELLRWIWIWDGWKSRCIYAFQNMIHEWIGLWPRPRHPHIARTGRCCAHLGICEFSVCETLCKNHVLKIVRLSVWLVDWSKKSVSSAIECMNCLKFYLVASRKNMFRRAPSRANRF